MAREHTTGSARCERRYEIAIPLPGLPRVLLAAAIGLLALHTALSIFHYRLEALPWLLRQLFDVDSENNLPTWFSGFLLLIASTLLLLCVQKQKQEGSRWVAHWTVLCVGFLLMSIDEVAGLHETINSIIVPTWAIGGAILAAVIGLAFAPFLLDLPRGTAVAFGIAGGLYVMGAVGTEIIGNDMVGKDLEDTLGYALVTTVEEGLEMIGVIVFIWALLAYMRGGPGAQVRAAVEITDAASGSGVAR